MHSEFQMQLQSNDSYLNYRKSCSLKGDVMKGNFYFFKVFRHDHYVLSGYNLLSDLSDPMKIYALLHERHSPDGYGNGYVNGGYIQLINLTIRSNSIHASSTNPASDLNTKSYDSIDVLSTKVSLFSISS